MNEEEEGAECDLERKAVKQMIENIYVGIEKTITTGNKEIEAILESQKA